MKRKRGSAKCNPKKPPATGAVDVDPAYYSDTNEQNNRFGSRTGFETKDVKAVQSGQHVDIDQLVSNNKTVGSAAAKLARVISSSPTNPANDKVSLQRPRIGEKEPKSSRREPEYNKQDLDAAHLVIKNIMETDAAVPFNTPVDPIALGIPDYFDIIDAPMDFGTICSKLENGLKYRNSEEVLKDVQLIWDNCCKYNKEDSHIVELMKRVKNNFTKQWIAAGLSKEQQTLSNGHLRHHQQLRDESTLRHEEAGHMDPVGSTISRSANLQQKDWNHRQHQQPSHCYSHNFRPQQISHQCPCSSQSQPDQHQHDVTPQHHHFTPLHSVDLVNAKCCSQLVNESGPSLVHSYQPSPGYSLIGHPNQSAFMHRPSSCRLPPYQLHAGINSQSAGDLHLPHRDPAPTFSKCQHALNPGRDTGDRYHSQHYQTSLVHKQAYHPSSSYMPVNQLHQSVTNQQSSHIMGGRNIDFAGSMRFPPPTESTANCNKRDTERPPAPTTCNASCQEPNQVNSSPEQSSSKANIEACEPLEKTCQNQPESSPSEHLHSTADNNFSKRNTQDQGLVCPEPLSFLMNNREHQSQPNICQFQEALHSKLSPPPGFHSTKPNKKMGGRGPNKEMTFKEGERIPITTNEEGEPVGPTAQKISTYLGTLARNGHFLPLTYLSWKSVPLENKQNLWEKVQSKFDIDPTSKDWVLQSLSDRWRHWKSKLKAAHYYAHETDAERLADRDERVLPDQWEALIKIWNSESMQKRSARNRKNRMQVKYIHAAGSKSFARIREEKGQRADMPDGREPSRAELFVMTRMRKNGKPVNEHNAEVIMQLREQAKDEDTPQGNTRQGDVLSEIIGTNKRGYTRCKELGPSSFANPSSAEAIKMVSEANSEIREMKQKMEAMEQTCAQMASQMAAMMSMMMSSMQKNIPNYNVPDAAAVSSGGASDHSVPEPAHTKQTSRTGSTSQTRRGRRKI